MKDNTDSTLSYKSLMLKGKRRRKIDKFQNFNTRNDQDRKKNQTIPFLLNILSIIISNFTFIFKKFLLVWENLIPQVAIC